MACTGLKIPREGEEGVNNLKIITETHDNRIVISYYACDSEFLPFGAAEITVSEKTEQEFHTELRIKADEKGHLIKEESTNPEWNPGYVAELEPPTPEGAEEE